MYFNRNVFVHMLIFALEIIVNISENCIFPHTWYGCLEIIQIVVLCTNKLSIKNMY